MSCATIGRCCQRVTGDTETCCAELGNKFWFALMIISALAIVVAAVVMAGKVDVTSTTTAFSATSGPLIMLGVATAVFVVGALAKLFCLYRATQPAAGA